MNEIRVYAALLCALLVGAYLSWTSEDDGSSASEVTLLDVAPSSIERIELVTTTQTVAFSLKGEPRYPWFDVAQAKRKQAFVGNDKAEDLMGRYAPFKAKRSLGRTLDAEERKKAGLAKPKTRLTITSGGNTRRFRVGGRTNGRREYYVQKDGGEEVFLIESSLIGDLERASSKFMQRTVLVKPLAEVAEVTLAANGKSRSFIQRFKADKKPDYWTAEGEDAPQQELKSFLLKLSRLNVRSYPTDQNVIDTATPVLEVSWKDDGGTVIGTTSLYRSGEGNAAKYYAKSDRTVLVGEVSRSTAGQLEKDLAAMLP